MKALKKLLQFLQFLLSLFGKKTPRPVETFSTDVERDEADNLLVNPGRKINWVTTSGKRLMMYSTGYQEGWFLEVIRAHWAGIRYILCKKSGKDYSRLEAIPTYVRCEIYSEMPVPGATAKEAKDALTGEPVRTLPDHVVWYVRYGGPNGPTLSFGHSHSNDTMRNRHGRADAEWFVDGKSIFSWCCNHPHVVRLDDGTLARCDIRYTGGDRKPVVVEL